MQQGWNIRLRPTRSLEFARPLGNRFEIELSRRRGVPTALQAMTTTSVARPASSQTISRTRHRVLSSTPARKAAGQ